MVEVFLLVSDGGDGSASIDFVESSDLANFLMNNEYPYSESYYLNEGSYTKITVDESTVSIFREGDLKHYNPKILEAYLENKGNWQPN